jgi:TonB family protein
MSDTTLRIPRAAVVVIASVLAHGAVAVALLIAGPLLAGDPDPGPEIRSVVVVRPDESTLLETERPDEVRPEWKPTPVAHPEPEDRAEEDVPDPEERPESRLEPVPLMPAPCDGEIAIRSLSGRVPAAPCGARRAPRAVVKTPVRVRARVGMRYRLVDLRRGHGEDLLRLRVRVTAEGRVEEVVVRERTGIVSFDEGAIRAVSHWTFVPATVDGEGVASEIDLTLSPARPRQVVPPEYPKQARDRGYQGVVRLAAEVGRDGRVRRVIVRESSGYGSLDEQAVEAVRRWVFRPAKVNGRPTGCTVEIRPIRFRLVG